MHLSQALTVIGAGSYGTALAMAVASKGFPVMLHARDGQKASHMEQSRQNERYLPGITFPESLHVTASLQKALSFARDVLLVVPSSAFVDTLLAIKPFWQPHQRLAWATKGLDSSGELLSKVIMKHMTSPDYPVLPIASLSGPTFAKELASGMPTAIACAGNDENFVTELCQLMHTKTFRVYKSHDLTALQLGGAVKNVIAIGAGMSDGLGFGANARTALISRGLAEIIRLGTALGASERGFMGLSGLGDLMLTCTDNQSRNRRLGYMLGKGMKIDEALREIGQVVEGCHMVSVVADLARRLQVEMPICFELYEVLINHKPGPQAAYDLLSRQITTE